MRQSGWCVYGRIKMWAKKNILFHGEVKTYKSGQKTKKRFLVEERHPVTALLVALWRISNWLVSVVHRKVNHRGEVFAVICDSL